jgi:selenocysteine lyase/cysteine desulfurase
MKESHIDFVAFTGHKSLMGPTGIGGLCTAAGAEIKATRQGGTGVKSKLLFHLEEYPYRLECGTLNVQGVGGLHAGVKWVLEEGMENIHAREMALWQKFRDGCRAIDGVITYCDDDPSRHSPVLSINVENWAAGDVGILLDADHNIATRTGLQCAPLIHKEIGTADIKGTVRFSFGAFNTEEHADRALEALEEIASLRRS